MAIQWAHYFQGTMKRQHSPRIHITLPRQLVEEITQYQKAFGWNRSIIIQLALRDWLAKQQSVKQKPANLVAGQPYDQNKSYKDYTRPDMSDMELLETLIEFEAAKEV
jgi:hypothetical protein